jgi:cation diffusion facilitator family transporter
LNKRSELAQRVTWIGFFANLILSLAKLAAGILGNSAAMVADAVHSFSDFITDIVVIVFVRVAGKESDEDHKYGHGKFETFATLLISIALLFVGLGICYNGLIRIKQSFSGQIIEAPSLIALIAALVSIISKELLYRYTANAGKSIDNQAVIANAWHHRSDAFSSIGTMLGIGGAMFLGGKWTILDPLAGVVVSLFIVKVAFQLGLPSVKELLEAALPEETEKEIINIIHLTPGVKDSHRLKTRKIGNIYAIDIHIQLDRDISFIESHDIATQVERNIRNRFGIQTHINIHTEPLKMLPQNTK